MQLMVKRPRMALTVQTVLRGSGHVVTHCLRELPRR